MELAIILPACLTACLPNPVKSLRYIKCHSSSSLSLRLLAILQKSWEPRFWEKMDSFVLLACASLAALRALLQQLLAWRFILLVQTKKVIPVNYGNSKSSWKPWRWVRLDLIFSMMDIYNNSNLNQLTKLTSSSRSTKFKEILP